MKRVIYFLMALVFITGCSQYEYVEPESGIKVKESVLEFAAKGGNGYIVVESDSPIETNSNSDWCKIKVVDKKIEVTVAPYTGLENRTAVVAISAGKDFPVNVPVTQSAARFIIKDFTFDVDFTATSVRTTVVSSEAVTVSTTDNWIDANYEDGAILITAAFNPKYVMRAGHVKVQSGIVTQTIKINQAARRFEYEDFIGDWTLSYINTIGKETARKSIDVKLLEKEEGKSFQLEPISNGGTVNGFLLVDFVMENAKTILRIKNAQSLPNYGQYIVKAVAWNAQTSFSDGAAITYQGAWHDNNGVATVEFADNGSWSTNKVNGLLIGAFNAAGVYQGYLYSMDYVIMTKK